MKNDAPFGALARRSLENELMDGTGLDDLGQRRDVLADLAAVNRLTRTHQPVLAWLRQAWARLPPGQAVSVLDVGCGQGDLLREIWHLAWREQRPVWLTGLDLHPMCIAAAREASPAAMNIRWLTGNVFEHDPGATDYIVSSQLAHHLRDEELVALLRWLQAHAERGWCIADLRRHWLPYLGFRWLARAAGWHPVVRIDGTRSIARACTPQEWQLLLARAGVAGRVRRHLPYRLTVCSAAPPHQPPPRSPPPSPGPTREGAPRLQGRLRP